METKKKIYIWVAVIVAIIIAIVAYNQITIYYYSTSAERINKKYEKRMEKINKDYEDALKAIETLKKYED